MNNTIAAYERRKIELRAQRAEAEKAHKNKLEAIEFEIKTAQEEIERQLVGLDSSIILHAEHIIYVGGKYAKAGFERGQCLEEAIRWILNGGGEMFREYTATKSYDRWHGQHTSHSYGMGPSHGSIIFEIGFTRAVRARQDKRLTEEEINACVYYLRNLECIQEAAEKAKLEAAIA
jgi:hypothetical protein